jgi:hypothetical protein
MGRTVYEIIPSPLYGWNFKNSESRHVIKYAKDKKELIDYAAAYCRTHSSELVIYDYFLEKEKVLSFDVDELIGDNEIVLL